MAKIKLIEVESDLGGRVAGASLGMEAMRIASYQNEEDFNFYDRFSGELYERITAPNHLFNAKNAHPRSKRIENIIPLYEKICASVKNGIKNNDFTIVVSGDHSSAGGTIAGIKSAFPKNNNEKEKKIGVIWIDAHGDVHTPYTSDSGNMHGMPIATAINDDNSDKNDEFKVYELDEESAALWEKIKSVGGTENKLEMKNVVFVALRDYEKAEESIIKKYNSKVIKTCEVRQKGAKNIADEIIKHLENCDIIYVSFDVDSMDLNVSVGTGTPVEDGLFADEAEELLKTLAVCEKVKCIEFSEINPTLDNKNKMAATAFSILKSVCEVIDSRFP
jgi:arginase